MNQRKIKILIIEDDVILGALLKDSVFNSDEFEFSIIHSFKDAKPILRELHSDSDVFDMIVLDLKLPDGSGLDLLKALRLINGELPVIILSSKNAEADRISGLEAGADDYLCKPFSLKELYIRVKKIINRLALKGKNLNQKSKNFIYKEMTINMQLREIYIKNERVNLTPNEFDILKYFIENNDKIIKRKDLIDNIWGGNFIANGTIDSYVSRLRTKISPFGNLIETIHGIGYKFKSDL